MREQLAEKGPENTISAYAAWFPINELKQWYENPQELQALETNPVDYFATRRGLYLGFDRPTVDVQRYFM